MVIQLSLSRKSHFLSVSGKTIREKDTAEELAYALGLLARTDQYNLFVRDYTSIHGDESEYLSKCGCFEATEELEKLAREQIKYRGKVAGAYEERQLPKEANRPRPTTKGADEAINKKYKELILRPKPGPGSLNRKRVNSQYLAALKRSRDGESSRTPMAPRQGHRQTGTTMQATIYTSGRTSSQSATRRLGHRTGIGFHWNRVLRSRLLGL